MKRILFTFLSITTITSCSVNKTSNHNNWSESKRLEYIHNVNDSTTWDFELFEEDKSYEDNGDTGPFEVGAFPVPKYSLIGKESFKGLGSIGGDYPMKNNTLVMNSFFVKKNELNKSRLKDRKDEIFFQIIIATDTIDNINYNLKANIAISRNHPDYLGQGFIKTKKNRIDYLAFQTPENNTYAIINTRIFDLNYGKTILISPQKDKSLKFLQIKSPELSSGSILEYTKKLIKEDKIIDFFEEKKKT